MKANKHFSTWSDEEVKQWLLSINLKRYVDSFCVNNVHGYDLCYLTGDDFKTLGILNIHDKNTLLKGIRLKTLEQLQIQVRYETKEVLIQLDFDSSFSVFNFAAFLSELFSIHTPIAIVTEANEILSPNVKLIELILLNPHKYKRVKVIKDFNEVLINASSSSPLQQRVGSRCELYQKGDYDEAMGDKGGIDYFRDDAREGGSDGNESYDSEENYESVKFNGRSQVIPIDEQDEETERNLRANRQENDTEGMGNKRQIQYNNKKSYWINSNEAMKSKVNDCIPLHSSSVIDNKKYNNAYDIKEEQRFNYDYKHPMQYSTQNTLGNNSTAPEQKRSLGYNKIITNVNP